MGDEAGEGAVQLANVDIDAASELELLGGGQEPRAGDALEEDSEAVAELASVLWNRRRSGGHL